MRLFLQIAPVWHIGRGPPALTVSSVILLILTLMVFALVEVGLLVLYVVWIENGTIY